MKIRKLKKKIISILTLIVITNVLLLNSEKSFAVVFIEDEYEENDTFSEAASITTRLHKNLSQTDEDWYKIYLYGLDEIQFKLFFDMNTVSMNFYLYNEINQLIAYSTNQTSFRLIGWKNNAYDVYVYLQVTGPNNGDLYDLDVLKIVGDDDFEQNDIRERAKDLIVGDFDGLVQYDDDWFVFSSINEKDNITVEMNYNSENYLEIEFTNEDGIPHDYLLKEESWGKKIEWTADGDNLDVYIHVYGNCSGVHYSLNLTIDESEDESSISGYQIEGILFFFVISSIILTFFAKRKNFLVKDFS